MRLVELLEKNDQKKLQILYYLDQNPNQKTKNSEIQAKLKISYYLFKNLTQEIAEDITTFQLSEFFNIEVTETETILYERHNTNASVFLEHYLDLSYQVKLLMSVLFSLKSLNLNDFAEDNFVSYAFIYKRFTLLRKTLSNWGIILTKNGELTGDELAVRLLLSKLMVTTNLPTTHFDSGVQDTVRDLFDIPNTPDVISSMSQLIETRAFFLVSIQRFSQGYLMSPSSEVASLIKEIHRRNVQVRFHAIQSFQTHFPTASEGEVNTECDYLVIFLAIMGVITSDEIIFPEAVKNKGKHFVQGFETTFSLSLGDVEKAIIEYEINKCFVDVLVLPFRSQFFDEHIEISYFFRTYPEFFEYCQSFILNETALEPDSNKARFMFYQSLLTLAANIPLNKILDPLIICVDFTLGKQYNKIIARDIMYFSTLNVQITDKVFPETSLIITDLVNAYKDFDVPKVIWLSPPRAEDWENLINEMLELRRKASTQ